MFIFFGDHVKLPSCNTLFIGKWASSCGRWEISPLLNISSAGRAAIAVHRSQRIAVDPNAHQFLPPGAGDDGCYHADVSRKKGEHPLNKTRMRMVFFCRGVVVLLSFWGGWRFHRSLPKEKARYLFILSEERSLNNQEGSKFLRLRANKSMGVGEGIQIFFWAGGNPRNLQGRWEIWTMVAPPRLGYRIDIISLNEIVYTT